MVRPLLKIYIAQNFDLLPSRRSSLLWMSESQIYPKFYSFKVEILPPQKKLRREGLIKVVMLSIILNIDNSVFSDTQSL